MMNEHDDAEKEKKQKKAQQGQAATDVQGAGPLKAARGERRKEMIGICKSCRINQCSRTKHDVRLQVVQQAPYLGGYERA